MRDYFGHEEILKLLKSFGFERSDLLSAKDFAQLENALGGVSDDSISGVLSGAFFYAEIIKQNVNSLTINKIIEVLNSVDNRTLSDISKLIYDLKKSGMDDKTIYKVTRQVHGHVLSLSQDENKSLTNLATQFVYSANKVSSTFSNMAKDLKKDFVAKIYYNCISRMKTFWQRVEVQNFKEVIGTLLSELKEDNFSEQELVELSSKCATTLSDSSKDKILGLASVLSDYKDFCLNIIENNPDLKTEELLKLKDFRVDQIFRTTASIAKSNTETLKHTSKFLQGNSIGEIFSSEIASHSHNARLYEKYKDLKLDLSINDMVWALTKSPSLFSTSLTKSLNFIERIETAIKQSYGDKADSVDFKNLITRENFLKGIPTNIDEKTIGKNIELLSCFMSISELENYLKSDMQIFSIENEKLQELIIEVFATGKNSKEIYGNLNNILKCKIVDELKQKNTDKQKEKKNKLEDINLKKEDTQGLPSVKLNMQELRDFAFDFDLRKLKILLGPHFNSFVETLKISGVDYVKLNEIVSEKRPEKKERAVDSEDFVQLDADMLQESAHSGYSVSKNKIETLWQLQRNITSAINLISLMKSKDEINEETIYILSSNYFKLAGEKNQIFEHLDDVDEHFVSTTNYLKEKTNNHFTLLTHDYSEVMRGSDDYLDGIIQKLNNQAKTLEKQMKKYDFSDIDERTELHLSDLRKTITDRLESSKLAYEENDKNLKQIKTQIRTKKFELEEEVKNPTPNKPQNNNLEKSNLFDLVYVSKREEILHIEIEKLYQTQDNIERKATEILREIERLQKLLNETDNKLKSTAIFVGLNQRLNEINSRLHYALKVKENINQDERK